MDHSIALHCSEDKINNLQYSLQHPSLWNIPLTFISPNSSISFFHLYLWLSVLLNQVPSTLFCITQMLSPSSEIFSSCCCCWITSVMSNSVRPHRWQPTRLPHPWDAPGKNTGVGCHFLLQCMKVKVKSLSLFLSPPNLVSSFHP